ADHQVVLRVRRAELVRPAPGARSGAPFPLMPGPSRTSSRLANFPWWLLAIALLGVVTLWAIVADAGYNQIFTTLYKGMLTTLWVTFVAFGLASLLGLVVSLARTSFNPWLRQVATFYVE